MARLCVIGVVLLGACSDRSSDHAPSPNQPASPSESAEHVEPEESPEPDEPADPDDPPEPAEPAADQGTACSSDLDCGTCSTPSCHCAIAGSADCGNGRCAADPCRARSASCSKGRCVVRRADADPCEQDSDCEIREDDCRCDVFAALRSAPRDDSCAGQTCPTRPSPAQFRARCDADARRCVLSRAGAGP